MLLSRTISAPCADGIAGRQLYLYQIYLRDIHQTNKEGRRTMKTPVIIIMVAVLGLLSAIPASAAPAGRPGEATDTPQQRESVGKKLDARLAELEARLKDLKSKLEHEGAKTDKELKREFERLQHKAQEVRKQLEQWKTEAPEHVERLKSRIESDLEDLRKSLEKSFPKKHDTET
jgi:transketolase